MDRLLRELREVASSGEPTEGHVEAASNTIYKGFFLGRILSVFTAGGIFGAVLLAVHAWERDLTILDYRAAV